MKHKREFEKELKKIMKLKKIEIAKELLTTRIVANTYRLRDSMKLFMGGQ